MIIRPLARRIALAIACGIGNSTPRTTAPSLLLDFLTQTYAVEG